MTGKTHSMVSCAAALTTSGIVFREYVPEILTYQDQNNGLGIVKCVAAVALTLVFTYMGGLLPDIDTDRSYIEGGAYYRGFPVLVHRGEMHSIYGCLLTGLLGLIASIFVPWLICIPLSLFVGELIHLFLDACTDLGVMWFYPFSKRRFHFIILSRVYKLLLNIGATIVYPFRNLVRKTVRITRNAIELQYKEILIRWLIFVPVVWCLAVPFWREAIVQLIYH